MSRAGLCLLLVLAACARVRPAGAATDDGGTRSPFANGPGVRALGMGSAFVGAADDASAAFWNPGGLGRLARFEAQTSFTQLEELGMVESFVGVAMPSWRLGTTAITLRHAGVDGIDGRDARDQPTGGDLTDSENEIALAYGRTAGERWGFGGAFKFQRQSLAGLSGSGLGADFGLTVRPNGEGGGRWSWLDGVTLGLAVRNLWQPSVRLDREAVPDPTTMQTGVGVRRLLAGNASLLATFDVEDPRGLDPRIHAGAELRFGSLLAMRAGLDRGRLTAGTALEWQGLAFEYGWEDRDFGARQHIGITHAFGPSVAQSRLAAREKAERDVQARLDGTYRDRQAQQIEDLLARAEAARAGARFDDALDLLTTIATLDSGNVGATALEVRCQREKGARLEAAGDLTGALLAYGRAHQLAPADSESAAAEVRLRAAGDAKARRSADRRRRYDEAFTQFLAGAFARAREGFAGLVAEEASDVDAQAMLARTEQALTRERAAAARPVATVTPASPPRPRETTAAASPATPPPSREQQRLAADLFRRGVQAMEARRSAEAVRYWEAVWAIDPHWEHVADYLLREYLVRGLEAYSAGQIDDAVAAWEKAVRVAPNDARAQAYLARAREQKQRARALVGDTP